jgi:hypothetical protein
MVLNLYDTLEDWGVVFGVGIDFGFESEVGFSFVHIALDFDDFLKD